MGSMRNKVDDLTTMECMILCYDEAGSARYDTMPKITNKQVRPIAATGKLYYTYVMRL